MKNEILNFCFEKGLLLDNEVLNLLSGSDIESVKFILEKIVSLTQKKLITKSVLNENKDKVNNLFSNLPLEKKESLENLKIKLGLSIEISKKQEIVKKKSENNLLEKNDSFSDNLVKIPFINKQSFNKIDVKDFVSHFRNRFIELRNILKEHSELTELVSINKFYGNRFNISLIGIVFKKRVTKNKNVILEIEDLTGKARVLIRKDDKNLLEKVDDIVLDSVIGFKGSGTREMFFVKDIIFPESMLPERKKSSVEEYVLFIGDLHFGSKKFLRKNFLKFIDYLNGKFPNTPEVDKIKYLFIVGDLVAGIGVYPNQESDLEIPDLEKQFSDLAELLSKIRKDIKIIISPGNHDGVRIMEPQPILDEKFAWMFYNLENVILTENPSYINIACRENFSGFNVLTYHGFSFPYFANNIPKLMIKKAMNFPEEISKYLLKYRHLAPTHESSQYYPLEKDALLIRDLPDIFVTAHTHKSAITYYNNILIISVSSWEDFTSYQEKFGNKPDHCKVPMLNLKTRAIRILDFEDKES